MAHADASTGKPLEAGAPAKDARQKVKAEPLKAEGDQHAAQPADMEVEAGEVDANKGTLLRPNAPEFQPGKDGAAAAAAARVPASSKRKETEHPSTSQVSDIVFVTCLG